MHLRLAYQEIATCFMKTVTVGLEVVNITLKAAWIYTNRDGGLVCNLLGILEEPTSMLEAGSL